MLIRQYKTKYNHQSSKLIQTYLNKEFITRMLNITIVNTESHEDKILILISKIKEYFDFDEILIYNTEEPINENHPGAFYRSIIRQYIDNNMDSICKNLQTKRIDIRKIKHQKMHLVLYIIPIEQSVKVKFAIFAQNNQDNMLNSGDIDTLSNPIRIILSAIFAKKIFY